MSYTYGDALATLIASNPRAVDDAFGARAANVANSMFWYHTDWRETLADLPPFWLQPNEQDHGPPAVIVPSDFSGLRQVYCVEISGDSQRRWPLKVQRDVELTHQHDLPTRIQYMPTTLAFRLWPRVPHSASSPQYLVNGTYKKSPTRVTAGTLHNTNLPWADDQFHVFVSCLQWALYFLSGDGRAGQVVKSSGGHQYTGQLAVVMHLLDSEAESEMLDQGEQGLAPEEPLVQPWAYGFW